MHDFEKTELWRSTLGSESADHKLATERLRTSFRSFRAQTSVLVSRISSALPDLTVHDITHLDALWETASVIAGDSSGLNPLEGYVLGGAILLHDAGHCVEAYEGGRAAVRASESWKDAMAAECARTPDGLQVEHEAAADFSALRHLHAEQASQLPGRHWRHPDNDTQLYLIEDAALREGLGDIIGKIAASHHWDIDSLVDRFPGQFNPPASLPQDWIVDPVRVACLLRCADAAHLDSRRSPSLVYALLRRHGVSRDHWRAQNRLTRAALGGKTAEASLLYFNSTSPFTKEEYRSWWVAYDAIQMVHGELAATESLLSRTGRGTFSAKGVAHAGNPASLAKYIETTGWTPTTAMPHISNVQSVVERLGGAQLYGAQADQLQVVLRELLQNARDAVVARAVLDPHHDPQIWIDVERAGSTAKISVSDNGVGMSERVLTGALLEFGQSFWSSDLVRTEFPGLVSSDFRPVGKFGIGFYSVFMVAREATVTSRRWADGIRDAKRLRFPDGLSMRPLLENSGQDDLRSDASTVVSLTLRDGVIAESLEMLVRQNIMGASDFHVPVADYVAAIAAGLDVPILFRATGQEYELVHLAAPVDGAEAREAWLTRISFAEHQPSSARWVAPAQEARRLRPIRDKRRCYGLAAISTAPAGAGMNCTPATGGLAADVHNRRDAPFLGWMDQVPNSAKRDVSEGYEAPSEVLTDWLREQEKLLEAENEVLFKAAPDQYHLRRVHASGHFLSFGFVPTGLLTVMVLPVGMASPEFADLDRLVELAGQTSLGLYVASYGQAESHMDLQPVPDAALVLPIGAGHCPAKLKAGIPSDPASLLQLVHERCTARGHTPIWKMESSPRRNRLGQPVSLLRLSLQA